MTAPTRTAVPTAARPARAGLTAFAALALLAGCGGMATADRVLGIVTPYKVEVVQGNVITREQLELIKPGQSRAQVRDILGSPLLMDVFHADRWDYMFTIRRQGAAPQQRQVVVRFEGDALKSIEAPELPAERDFVASIDTFKTSRNAPPLELSESQLKALPTPATRGAAAVAPAASDAAPARSFPPLERK
jgi:outer membrane protein assembly factor BamE